jgi:hypothetical protein
MRRSGRAAAPVAAALVVAGLAACGGGGARDPFGGSCVAAGAEVCAALPFGEVEVGANVAYTGALAACSPDPATQGVPQGWRLEVEAVRATPAYEQYGQLLVDTVVEGRRLDAGGCGAALRVRLPRYGLRFDPGVVVHVDGRITARNPETDVLVTWTLRDEAGRLLLGTSANTRPDAFDADMFDGLTLSMAEPTCAATADQWTPSSATYAAPDGSSCTAAHGELACCTLWSRPYTLIQQIAYREASGRPQITFALAAPGVLREP